MNPSSTPSVGAHCKERRARERGLRVVLSMVFTLGMVGIPWFAQDLEFDWWWGGLWPFAFWWAAQGALLFVLILLWGHVYYCQRYRIDGDEDSVPDGLIDTAKPCAAPNHD